MGRHFTALKQGGGQMSKVESSGNDSERWQIMSDREAENSQELWGGRFSEPTDAFVQRFTASEAFDRQLAVYDIAGSSAHAEMLMSTGVLFNPY